MDPTLSTGDVENGTVPSPTNDTFTIGDDDASTLQPPPSDMDYHREDDATNFDHVNIVDDEDEEAVVHDQLPTAEEYKAKMMAGGGAPSPRASTGRHGSGGDGDDDVHDQLPSVEEYKSSMIVHEDSTPKKSRAGLYTFLLLLLVTVIATA
jgi:hypothetical protein